MTECFDRIPIGVEVESSNGLSTTGNWIYEGSTTTPSIISTDVHSTPSFGNKDQFDYEQKKRAHFELRKRAIQKHWKGKR